ncbi:hypothetical protein [Clostridium sp.]|uniref:hypothetical protein n=1 Tax=Clostridium sp. TaxID=1506 RepID=UPI001A414A44|nr:hypothetical protein [Clostridium sp.]MBK5243289.1 hypothetical protein [Clostridium sp.]
MYSCFSEHRNKWLVKYVNTRWLEFLLGAYENESDALKKLFLRLKNMHRLRDLLNESA